MHRVRDCYTHKCNMGFNCRVICFRALNFSDPANFVEDFSKKRGYCGWSRSGYSAFYYDYDIPLKLRDLRWFRYASFTRTTRLFLKKLSKRKIVHLRLDSENISFLKFSKWYKKVFGEDVTPGKAGDWVGSQNHARNFGAPQCWRRVAFSRFSESYKAIIEPKISYASWADAKRENEYEARQAGLI